MKINTFHLPLRKEDLEATSERHDRSCLRHMQNSSVTQGKRTGRVPSLPKYTFTEPKED